MNLTKNMYARSRHNTSEEERLFQNSHPKSAFGRTIDLYKILEDYGCMPFLCTPQFTRLKNVDLSFELHSETVSLKDIYLSKIIPK